jgi:hypothetical protein
MPKNVRERILKEDILNATQLSVEIDDNKIIKYLSRRREEEKKTKKKKYIVGKRDVNYQRVELSSLSSFVCQIKPIRGNRLTHYWHGFKRELLGKTPSHMTFYR